MHNVHSDPGFSALGHFIMGKLTHVQSVDSSVKTKFILRLRSRGTVLIITGYNRIQLLFPDKLTSKCLKTSKEK